MREKTLGDLTQRMPLAAVGKIVSEERQTWMSGCMKHRNESEENKLQQSGRIMQ